MCNGGNNFRQQPSLDNFDSLVQARLVVIGQHRDGLLREHRAGIDTRIDKVDRRPGDLHAVRQRVRHRMRAGKRRQQRRMGIDDPATEPFEEARTKQFHEAGRDDQVGMELVDGIGQRFVPCRAVRVVAQGDAEMRYRSVLGMFGGGTVAVDSDSNDCAWIVGTERGVDKRLKQRPRPGCEYDDSSRGRCGQPLWFTRGSQRSSPGTIGRIGRDSDRTRD